MSQVEEERLRFRQKLTASSRSQVRNTQTLIYLFVFVCVCLKLLCLFRSFQIPKKKNAWGAEWGSWRTRWGNYRRRVSDVLICQVDADDVTMSPPLRWVSSVSHWLLISSRERSLSSSPPETASGCSLWDTTSPIRWPPSHAVQFHPSWSLRRSDWTAAWGRRSLGCP